VPGACIARKCQGPDPAAHFTASASGTQGLTYAVSQDISFDAKRDLGPETEGDHEDRP
jgi:hypothetical protein